ncbi:MAG: acyl carrier protein [Candidatus Thiodiazotropha sp. (ex Lucinoma kastoroae)]|nr:acyl carrier protein [Candidatus Thiodiazotropha sp. (ex Rostrolucina anterorostrata)]MCU7849903.1 acyl carrier protein [Candidatus Thiodiazotropha sp. (ex Lucinoma kastoroae)]MCU7858743.1 acyl carrier protein [Candidatus Thiodiazotropha sp. (ex Lucinoma kastoroae)]
MIDELKELLINELNLEEMSPADIDENLPLFGDGIGLDSIDALELAVILDKRYGVKIKSGDKRNVEVFSSLSSLAKFIRENRTL